MLLPKPVVFAALVAACFAGLLLVAMERAQRSIRSALKRGVNSDELIVNERPA